MFLGEFDSHSIVEEEQSHYLLYIHKRWQTFYPCHYKLMLLPNIPDISPRITVKMVAGNLNRGDHVLYPVPFSIWNQAVSFLQTIVYRISDELSAR